MSERRVIDAGYADVNWLSEAILSVPDSASDATVVIQDTPLQSAELVAGSLYMLCPSVNCYVAFGTNPTAVATNRRLIADREYPFFVPRAGKFSVKRESYDGVLWISKHSLSME
jgi:hypothetical protein